MQRRSRSPKVQVTARWANRQVWYLEVDREKITHAGIHSERVRALDLWMRPLYFDCFIITKSTTKERSWLASFVISSWSIRQQAEGLND